MAIVAHYLFNGADSGTTPALVADNTGNGGDLAIDFSSGDAAWFSDAQGRGLDFLAAPVAANAAVATLTNVAANGALGTAYNGVTRFAFAIKTGLDAGHSFGSRIFQIGTDTGNGELALIDGEFAPSLRLNGVGVVDFPNLDGNENNIAYVEVDTSAAAAEDRITVYYGNVEQSLANNTIAQNQSIDLNNASYSLTVGNRGDGNRGVDGRVKHLVFFDDHLTTQQRADLFSRLAVNDDIDPLAEPPNVGPVADDATYSIQADAQNGDVIATYAATDSDGTIATYSLDNAVLAIDNTGVLTLADNSGLVAGTPIIANVTATDDDGDTDVARITVNVTVPVLTLGAVTPAGPHQVGDSLNVALSNASASGKQISIPAGTIPDTGQNSAGINFDIINPLTFGNRTTGFNEDIPFTITDGGESVNFTRQIAPNPSDFFGVIGAKTGIWANAAFSAVPVGTQAYVITTGDIDIPSGSVLNGHTYDVYLKHPTTQIWSYTNVITPGASAPTDNPATGNIVVNGTAQEGQTISIDVSGIADPDGIQGFAYSFTINSTEVSNTNSYTIQSGDVGQVIDIAVTMTDTNGVDYPFSAQTGVVTALPTGDTQAPTLSLNGAASIVHIQGQPFTDQGANWIDNVDGSGTAYADIALNINSLGPQTLRYNHTDAAGNAATEVTRLVTVIAAPVPGVKADSILTSEGWLVGEFPGQIDRPEATLGSEGWEV